MESRLESPRISGLATFAILKTFFLLHLELGKEGKDGKNAIRGDLALYISIVTSVHKVRNANRSQCRTLGGRRLRWSD
jgi:hypothetical protein